MCTTQKEYKYFTACSLLINAWLLSHVVAINFYYNIVLAVLCYNVKNALVSGPGIAYEFL